MTCPEIPLWYHGLAVTGAVFLVAAVIWPLLWFLWSKPPPATHIGQIERHLFLPSIGRRLTGSVHAAGRSIADLFKRAVRARQD